MIFSRAKSRLLALLGGAAIAGATSVGAAHASDLVVLLPPLYGPSIERTVSPVMKEKYGVDVIWQEANSSESFAKVLAEKAAPEISVSCPATLDFLRGQEAGLWAKLDADKIPNLADIYDFAKQDPFGEYGVAITIGGAVLQYHKEAFEKNGWAPPTSWKDMARPELKGHVAMASTAWGTGVGLLSLWSRLEGAGRGDAGPAFAFVKDLVAKGQIGYFPTRGSELNSAMERGEIWIGPQWSEAGLQFAAQGGPVGIVNPTEGTFVLPNICAVVADSPNIEAANAFVDLLLGEEAQRDLAVDRWASPVRKGVVLPAEYQDKLLLSEEQIAKVKFLDDTELAEFKPKWHEQWVHEIETGAQ